MTQSVNDHTNEVREGGRIYALASRIFPLFRSITGEGVRQTLAVLNESLADCGVQFAITEVPTGTKVFDWTVPKEWRIREAYIADEKGHHVIDIKEHNLHVLGYATSVDCIVPLKELRQYVYTQEDQPDVIPYVTSYYKERFGFCMSQNQLDALPEGDYRMVIDSELFDGSMTIADLVLPGDSDEEILITSYTCHPSMANNECSGPALLTELVRYVCSMEKRRYTYRFVLNPETIGAITYLSTHRAHLQSHVKAGVVLSCVGDDRAYSIIHTKYADTFTDRTLAAVLADRPGVHAYSFLDRGSDERQYNAPGIDLPVVAFCRTRHGVYPEYHTSADNLDLVSPRGFQGAFDVMKEWIDGLEHNAYYRTTVLCEPQLGKRGLYPTESKKNSYGGVKTMMALIAYADGKNDLFDISRLVHAPVRALLPIVEELCAHGLMERL